MRTLLLLLLWAQVISTGNHRKIFSGGGGGCSTFTDAFTTPGALSGNWTVPIAAGYTSINQGSGFAQTNPASTKAIAVYSAGSTGGDHCSQMTINLGSNLNALGATGPVVMDTSANGYAWIISANVIYLVTAGGGVSPIGTGCPNTNNGDQVKLTFTASTHTLTCTDITSGFTASGTDSTYSSTLLAGMLIDAGSAAVQMSSWSGQ